MTSLQWDSNDHVFETGIDRGVLYLTDGTVVPWNGLTGIDESESRNSNVYYLDGQKYLDSQIPGDFTGNLKAFTYPDEFENVEQFCMSYRTLLESDLGYKIHILYNVRANLSDKDFQTEADDINAIEFSWDLTATPDDLEGFRATSHISFDSRNTPGEVLAGLEAVLYGTDDVNPALPTLQELINQLIGLANILIVDNHDGTWTAYGPSDDVYLTDSTTFQIDNVNATYSDADTYIVSTTELF